MNLGYWHLLATVAPVFLVIAAGFGLRQRCWLSADADESLLRIIVNVLYPCLIVDAMLGNPALAEWTNVAYPPLVGFGSVVLGYGVALLAARLLPIPAGPQRRTFAFTTGLYNYSYIPVPIVQSLFDRPTMGVLFTHNLGVEIAFWTIGILLLTAAAPRRSWRKAFNAPVLAIIAALALSAVQAQEWTPGFVLAAVHMLAITAVPVALLLTGATFADLMAAAGPQTSRAVALGACALRLGLLPLLFLLVARSLPCSAELKRVIVIQAAMPAAMLPIVVARHYGGDANIAFHVVLSTTVLALLTIPCWIRFGLVFVGV